MKTGCLVAFAPRLLETMELVLVRCLTVCCRMGRREVQKDRSFCTFEKRFNLTCQKEECIVICKCE